MEKKRESQALVIIALIVAVLCLSIGFAAFSTSLDIKSTAEVVADKDNLKLQFSTSSDGSVVGTIKPSYETLGDAEEPTGTEATIDNTDSANPKIKNLSAHFTEPGQVVKYKFYSYNNGKADAYLRAIKFEGDGKSCVGSAELTNKVAASAESAAKVCNNIKINVSVANQVETEVTKEDITDHLLYKNSAEEILVTITYEEQGAVADGDIKVTFDDIILNYQLVDAN